MRAILNRLWSRTGRDDRPKPIEPEVPVNAASIGVARAENFPAAGPLPWLDRLDAPERIAARLADGSLTEEQAALCRKWHDDGYIVLKRFFPAERLASVWSAYEAAIADGRVVPPPEEYEEGMPGRVLNPHFRVDPVREMLADPAMVAITDLLFGVRTLPFQTIIGHKGSEQKTHSDSIHMTTYPQGYLAANWIAFEDIHADSGPLVYYPGSHRLPYAYSREVGIALEEGRAGYDAYHAKYEPFIEAAIRDNGLLPAYFEAEAGDVLVWHANLLHGGSPRRDRRWSRKALVCHYFAEGCICYHDYSGNLSHLHLSKQVPREEFDAAAYLAANPDVAAAGVDAYRHYVSHGVAEGRRLRPDG